MRELISRQIMAKTQSLKSFTLAEVLLTLGVIGVVAALTVPTLIQSNQEKANVTALKKVYSTLSNAYTLAVQENGTPDTWGLVLSPAISAQVLGYLKPYLRVEKDCLDGSLGCWPAGVMYKLLSSGDNNLHDNRVNAKLRLADGMSILGWTNSADCTQSFGDTPALQSICGEYLVDINGAKNPNQYGIDLFGFWLTKYGIIPKGNATMTSNAIFADTCRDRKLQSGTGCTAWVIYNENMDYLHCDDLAWGGKTKCD